MTPDGMHTPESRAYGIIVFLCILALAGVYVGTMLGL